MPIWKIEDTATGSFKIKRPSQTGDLYFPLTNTQGKVFSCISPFLSGDIKRGKHEFLTYPATVFDLKNPFCIRTLWLYLGKKQVLNISPYWPTKDKITCHMGLLWHKLIRYNKKNKLNIEVINFIPEGYPVEVMHITIRNKGIRPRKITPLTSIPLFGRSEENLRNHRHVTSLLNQARIDKKGITLTPTMHFDERGHKKNNTSYFVYGFTDKKNKLAGVFSTLEEFTGPKGNLVFPQSLYSNAAPCQNRNIAGKETIAALKFTPVTLKPGQELNIFLVMGIEKSSLVSKTYSNFDSPAKIKTALKKSRQSWLKYWDNSNFHSNNPEFDFWLRWVNIQPVLRKLFGCSFIAHFDYGKGGRGWRDLWQDFIADILPQPEKVKEMILNNFRGVRIDASNATIITPKGEFLSDRDRINRVWTDHGVWPFLILEKYINRTNDYKILFKQVCFFKDHQLMRSRELNLEKINKSAQEYKLKDKNKKIYKSSILDHILIQNLVQFFNVGPKGNVRLENADWNDALDMAPDKGESVAFSCMYAYNLARLRSLLSKIKGSDKKIRKIEITKEASLLLDTLSKKIDYNNPLKKQRLLQEYLQKTKYTVKGTKVKISLERIINDLTRKSEWMINHIRKKEWIQGPGIFNGYYDNKSRRVEGRNKGKLNIMLPSQAFPVISGIATRDQIKKIWKALDKNLRLPNSYALKLNTDFEKLNLDLGRAFGFSYGEKENGSVFSHMNVLMSYGLYKQGFVKEGYKIFSSLFKLSTSQSSQIAPGIPEYFNLQKKGLYPYLTGSASWLIYLFTNQIFGIRFCSGKLIIKPKLVKEQFSFSSSISFSTNIESNIFTLSYHNPEKKDWPDYTIGAYTLNGEEKIIKDNLIEFSPAQTRKILSLPKTHLKIKLI